MGSACSGWAGTETGTSVVVTEGVMEGVTELGRGVIEGKPGVAGGVGGWLLEGGDRGAVAGDPRFSYFLNTWRGV